MSKFSETLKQLRKDSNLSVNDVIEKLKLYGVEIGTKAFYHWESGRRMPDADEFIYLCEIYGVESFSIFNEETEKAPASEEAGAKENVSLEETNAVLVEMGYIRQGEQLSDADFAFLEHIGGLMDAWFSSKHP